YGDLLSKLWGQPVLVENRPGGSGILAVQAVKNAPPDGYTLLMATNSPMTVNPVVMKNLPYDPIKDFRPVIGVSKSAAAFIVRADSPYKTIKDLIDGARKAGGPLAVGNYSAGSELIGAWLGTVAGLEITPVPYKGGAPMMTDVVGGQLTTGAIDFAGAAPLIRDGRLRALAITSDVRYPAFPNVPTMRESGYPEFETYVWASFFVRADTPDDITTKLYEGFRTVMASPEARTYQASQPAMVMTLGPQELRAFVIAEYERFKRVAQAAGIQPR
ncbi:MAG: tripartite tricarboxylate transporter substrate binding protein, partial [Burkholderiales bacterium]|nr:tripartite tricarboxylate transporter substrate binding protein [Burkholderiales bacterium]